MSRPAPICLEVCCLGGSDIATKNNECVTVKIEIVVELNVRFRAPTCKTVDNPVAVILIGVHVYL